MVDFLYVLHISYFDFVEDGTNTLRQQLMENIDFTVVPEEAWNSLVQWYTLTEGQVRNVSVLQFMISEDETFYLFDCTVKSLWSFVAYI